MIATTNEAPILIVENNDEQGVTLSKAIRRAGLNNPLLRLPNAEAAQLYLSGTGNFSDREKHPLPCFVLFDITLPALAGVEMLPWLKSPPANRQIVVTSSGRELDPNEFESAVAFSPHSILCKLSTLESLAAMLTKLRDMVINHEAPALAAT